MPVPPSVSARVLAAAFSLLALASSGCLAPRAFDEAAWRARVDSTRLADLRAPNRLSDGTFVAPWMPMGRGGADFLRWTLSRNAFGDDDAGSEPAPSVPNDGSFLTADGAPPTLAHVGHATFAIRWGGQVVVTDPFFSSRALLPKRLVPPPFGPEAFPERTVVLISHNHYDHLDAPSVEALARRRAVFLCPKGLGGYIASLGATDVTEADWWQKVSVDGTEFTFLPTQHWSRRIGQGRNETLWGAWLLSRGGIRIFYGGDSGYFRGFAEYGRLFPGIDVALLGVGAYAPRWFMHYAHMDIPETVRAFRDLGARRLVPTQWGVLRLGDDPVSRPILELRKAAVSDPGLAARLVVPPVGGTIPLTPPPP